MVDFNDFKKRIAIDINKSIPTAAVELPSNGAKALIRSMKVKDQKDFLKALEKKDEYLINECFDMILSTCVESIDGKGFDNDLLCIQDRSYLLLKIREVTTGPLAKISHICPQSGKVVNDIEIDISKLPVDKFLGKDINQTVDLTENIRVVLSPVTRKIEKEIESWFKKQPGEASMVDRRYCAYAGVIRKVLVKTGEEYEEVDGLTFDKRLEFLTQYCPPQQLKKLDDYMSILDFGIRPVFHFKSDVYENEKEEANLISFFIM